MATAKIIVIEDEIVISMNIKNMLEKKGYEVIATGFTGEEAIDLAKKHNPDLILMDIILEGHMDGITAYEMIKAQHNIPVIFLTANFDDSTLNRVITCMPEGYILKPVNWNELYSSIEIALYRHGIEMEIMEKKQKLSQAQSLVNMGSFEWNFLENKMCWSDEMCRLFGLEPDEVECSYDIYLEKIHPDDRERVKSEIDESIEKIKTFESEYMVIREDGQVRSHNAIGKVFNDDKGKPYRILVVVQDITAIKSDTDTDTDKGNNEFHPFQTTFEIARIGIAHVSLDGNFLRANKRLCSMLRYTEEELKAIKFSDITHPEDIPSSLENLKNILSGKINDFSAEKRYIRNDGSIMWARLSVVLLRTKTGKPMYFVSIIEDITEHQQADEELKESEEKYRRLFELESDPIFLVDAETTGIIDSNRAATEMYGYTNEEFKQLKVTDISAEPEKTKKSILEEHLTRIPHRYSRKKDGTIFPAEISANYFKLDGKKVNLSRVQDITDRINSAEKLKATLRDKELLLTEIKHRVKNNFEIIISLMSLQSQHMRDDFDLGLCRDIHNRVRFMSVLHEYLYQSDDIRNINFSDYIDIIVSEIEQIYHEKSNLIKVSTHVKDVTLGMDRAATCALIINEILDNSYKHAFGENKKGYIKIKFNKDRNGNYILLIEDNGKGMPKDFDFEGSKSLGIQLLRALTSKLRGQIKLTGRKGVQFEITLPV
ncbi:PAS domain S-box protein [Spirochaetota bacterium]